MRECIPWGRSASGFLKFGLFFMEFVPSRPEEWSITTRECHSGSVIPIHSLVLLNALWSSAGVWQGVTKWWRCPRRAVPIYTVLFLQILQYDERYSILSISHIDTSCRYKYKERNFWARKRYEIWSLDCIFITDMFLVCMNSIICKCVKALETKYSRSKVYSSTILKMHPTHLWL